MHPRARDLIETLHLTPHPEGGFYRQVVKSDRIVGGNRSALTAIHFLLPRGDHSRWHRVSSDEIWVSLEGDGVSLHTFDGLSIESHEIHGHKFRNVPGGHWQAAEPLGDYALVTCIVAPGFEYEDFTMMAGDESAIAHLRNVASSFTRLI